MNPVQLIVGEISQDQKFQVFQDPNVKSGYRRSGDVEISQGWQVPKRPLRDILDVAAIDLEQLQLPETHDPRHCHDLRVLHTEDRQLAQEVDGIGGQALELRLLDVDLTLVKEMNFSQVG